MENKGPCIELEHVSKRFGDQPVLRDIHLTINHGEFLTFLGPSGCGKTTILRLLAGFERPSSGRIRIGGVDVTETPPHLRAVNTVFQNYALFPHMTVFDNVAFGLRMRRAQARVIEEEVFSALRMVKMETHHSRRPGQLSGGQQQRVAIARAVVNKPLVLLLDEPLSALDYKLRKAMQIELKELRRKLGITFVFVTHDQEEAFSMSDRVAVMNEGVIEQLDSPSVIYEKPQNLFVARFVGEINTFEGQVVSRNGASMQAMVEGENVKLSLGGNGNGNGSHGAPGTRTVSSLCAGSRIKVLLRPEDVRLERAAPGDLGGLTGAIVDTVYKGMTIDLIIEMAGGKKILATEFFNEDAPQALFSVGDRVRVGWVEDWEVVLPDEGPQPL
ncbi:spermidine/putrescine ABC transporter ATP-binding protein PotA [Desulfolutivibrio sulfoxidireducens]|uniref:spermidine/putrescine ABC transporter ATP-binding protein PotA n=1 Tax=Desulfolutivibrio sulfoxidireducens TaxID=2773299 RepID=UPI00159DEA36|nr:spermidine/putrescine ABC transporter ATP-binding protein PotA [Desulfolutivibrio sulfoxidireducens]QLA16385.1 spermidine/putrescine ABC transporter ATP-binding protein PotA [Desulfolutivibrio sulfoxidireducens]QLA19734.1 spermidine/putrescine ABC transporter ATP-binding protein PotA [Desulfolutivibrio sulfoxidireducens]